MTHDVSTSFPIALSSRRHWFHESALNLVWVCTECSASPIPPLEVRGRSAQWLYIRAHSACGESFQFWAIVLFWFLQKIVTTRLTWTFVWNFGWRNEDYSHSRKFVKQRFEIHRIIRKSLLSTLRESKQPNKLLILLSPHLPLMMTERRGYNNEWSLFFLNYSGRMTQLSVWTTNKSHREEQNRESLCTTHSSSHFLRMNNPRYPCRLLLPFFFLSGRNGMKEIPELECSRHS